jgi:hypothetical protein
MRMVHYFLAMALIAVPALLLTAATGIFAGPGELHLSVGLFAAIFTVATHTLLILFMIVTGKVLKAAMATRPLSPEFLTELNAFFAEKRAYPVSALAAVSIVAAAVLGYGRRAFDLPAEVHMLVGIGALAFNLWALSVEVAALRENQALLDRTARALDALDRERDARGEVLPEEAEAPVPAWRWLVFAGSAWLPYLYWGVIEWKGEFHRVSMWLPVVCGVLSLGALVGAWGARGRVSHP